MRGPLLVVTSIFLATLLSRLPFLSQQLWAWDSVLYARALESGFHVDYTLINQRPHPPGYLLYVAAGAVARSFTGDSNTALVIVAALASALAAGSLFLFARNFASDRAAALVAVGFAVNPLVWQYSEVAYPYTVLSLLSIAIAACFVATRARGPVGLVVASAAFGAAAGFRQDLLLILAPLWLWTLWPHSWRVRAAGFGAVCIGSLVWLVPTMLLSGGPLAYVAALVRQTDYVRATYSVFAQGVQALGVNLATTLYALGWGLGLFALPVIVLASLGAFRAACARRVALGRSDVILLLWTAPAIGLYLVVHIGEWGYVLSVLPGLYALSAVAIDRIVPLAVRRSVSTPALAARRAALAAALIVPALVFTTSSAPFSAAAVATHDAELSARVAYVRDHYPAHSTLILAREDYLLVRYYLAEYRAWFHDPDPFHSTLRRKRVPKVTAMVVFTPGLRATSADARRIECAKDVQLVYLDVEPGSVVELFGERYTVSESLR